MRAKILWLVAIFCLFLVVFAHEFFQKYLFMRPCEQCVYIRLDFLIIALGAFLGTIKFIRFFGGAIAIFGAISGINHSLILNKIHAALHSDLPFGVSGCNAEPSFIFNLNLHEAMPSLFMPTGECGNDSPIIPSGIKLSKTQEFFINLYENGWYLAPKWEFLNMAQCTLIAFIICIVLIFWAFLPKNHFLDRFSSSFTFKSTNL